MKTEKIVVMLVVAFCFLALPVFSQGVTIYVDAANAGSPTMDGSQGDPWDTVQKAVDHLAEVNDPAQGGVQGGHTVLISAGKYITDIIDLDSTHAGEEGNVNVLRADGLVHVQGPATGTFRFESGAQHLAIDGLLLAGQGRWGQIQIRSGAGNLLFENMTFESSYGGSTGAERHILGQGGSFTVRRSSFRGQIRAAAVEQQTAASVAIEESVFFGNRLGIRITGNATVNISDSIIANNRSYGLQITASSPVVNVERTLFFANGLYNAYFAGTGKTYETEADFAILSEEPNMNFSNIIVSNPGFAGLHEAWNYNLCYASSPVLKENSGFVRDIGLSQDPPTVPVFENTYYVNAATGDDSRTSAQAQNENTPWLTIGRAAEHALAGDTVIVKPGVYVEEVVITNSGSGDMALTFKAEGDVTVQSQIKMDRVAGVVLDGFKLTGTPSQTSWQDGPNIWIVNSFGNTILNTVVYDSPYPNAWTTPLKAGIGMSSANRTMIKDTVVYACQRGVQGQGAGGLILEGSLIYSNAWGNVTGVESAHIFNSAVFDNTDPDYNAVYLSAGNHWQSHASIIENCVVAGAPGSGVANDENAIVNIINTVIFGNATGIMQDAGITVRHSCFHGNQDNLNISGVIYNLESEINNVGDNENNIVADPQFRNMFYADFRLSQDSPCVNAGTSTTELETDMYGNPRLIGPAVDIGVYEMPYSGSIMQFF